MNGSEFMAFETERLSIKPTSVKDADLILELMNTEKWIRFVGDRNLQTIQDAENYIKKRMLPQLHKLGFSNFTIFRKEDDQKIGICGLYSREGLDHIDIGFGLLPQFEKNGYAFEAASRILKAGFEDFKLRNICGITDKENFESQKLLEKLGLTLSGTVRLPGEEEDILLYKARN